MIHPAEGRLQSCLYRQSDKKGKYRYGGGVLGGDGAVYALPSDAERVLRIVPHTNEVIPIGPSFTEAHNKWQNGFLCRDGAIYGIPCDSEDVIRIVPATGEVTTFGGPFVGSEKWEGGVLGSDGVIYGMPQQSQQVLKIIPASVMNAGH